MRDQRFSELRLDRIGRNFGEQAALSGLTLTIRGGEFIALLGPSGCGKSTALNCLAGLLPLSSGSIWLDDKRIDGLPPEQRGFGMVFQNYALFPHMTVRDNIAFGLKMRKTPKAQMRPRLDEVMRLVRLEDQANKLPAQLSGGQQQRVAIARALITRPTVLFADEPTGNLDSKTGGEILNLLHDSVETLGQTIVMVTHDARVATIADRVLFLADGEIVKELPETTPEEIQKAIQEIGR